MSFKNKSHKIIRKVIAIAFASILIQSILCAKGLVVQANTSQNYTTEQKAIREVADAYYRRGINGQYCSMRLSQVYPPEEGTVQHTIYSVCSNFTHSVYYQTFGIQVQGGFASTHRIQAYAYKYYDPNNIKTNDVIEFWEKSTDENGNIIYKDNKNNIKNIDLKTEEGRKNYGKKLLKDCSLQVGDIICYHTGIENSNEGHALLVYEIIYDENGEPVDAIIRESTSKHEKKTTKITKGLSFWDVLNEKNNVHEGTFKELYLINDYNTSSTVSRKSVIYYARDKSYFTIYRPLLKDENGNYTGKYYYATFKDSANTKPAGQVCTGRTLTDYSITDTTLQRLKYSKIYIEKTVDVFNNSVVNLGDTLEYTIKITNNSDNKYNGFDVIENIPEYVQVFDSANGNVQDNKIIWTIPSLEAKQSIEIKYRVKVKNDVANLGKEIISTGKAAGIPSSTVKNIISNNLKQNEKLEIKNKAQTMLNAKEYNGQELITKIYNETFGININIKDLDITELIKTKNGTVFYPKSDSRVSSIYLNKDNSFSNMVLNNYYGALYTNNDGVVYLKNWQNPNYKTERSERADNIYSKNLQTGDILVYKNKQTANDDVQYKTEDGTYYLIYISEEDKIKIGDDEVYGFIGINEDGSINRIYGDESINYTSHDLRTLLGKDYYVILRPSMTFEVTSIADLNQNDQIDLGDILLMRRHLAQANSSLVANKHTDWKLNDKKISIGDLNKNNQIDIGDILKTQRYIAAKNSKEVAAKHVDWLDL